MSVWRCAENAEERAWDLLARALVVAWALNVGLVGSFLGLDLLGSTLV
ncbi:MAG: hypothetical protein U5K43_07205 [Halofilum sp. (in: g-proteobacteria)]|nr:hypothetical protein [Halofilum sp. (in: g-proteobacteria)]